MKRIGLVAIAALVALLAIGLGVKSWAQTATNKLYVDSFPRGANVYVANKAELPEEEDTPRGEKFLKGKTPLVLDVKPAVYAVHIELPLAVFAACPPAKKIVDQYVKDFANSRGPYAINEKPEAPFFWSGSSITTYNYGGVSSRELKILGHVYYVNCEEGDARGVGIWWPKGLTLADLEPLLPPKEKAFTVGTVKLDIKGILEGEYQLKGEILANVMAAMERCGMAVLAMDNPHGRPNASEMVFWLGSPNGGGFSIAQRDTPKLSSK